MCGLPQAAASRLYGVVELERSCKHDARSVAAARMAVLACANALGIALIAASVSCHAHADTSLVFSLVCAFAPYCLTAAGCLVAVRRMGGARACRLPPPGGRRGGRRVFRGVVHAVAL
ncbi:MAG: hypothetical protein ACLT98_08695 [Eggerthellaceae bacterium]